jgi:hypothetical protein
MPFSCAVRVRQQIRMDAAITLWSGFGMLPLKHAVGRSMAFRAAWLKPCASQTEAHRFGRG